MNTTRASPAPAGASAWFAGRYRLRFAQSRSPTSLAITLFSAVASSGQLGGAGGAAACDGAAAWPAADSNVIRTSSISLTSSRLPSSKNALFCLGTAVNTIDARRRGHLPGVTAGLLLAIPAALALGVQQPSQQPPIIRARTNLVRVDVTVTDSRGNPVTTLTADDFEVQEDGVPQAVQTFKFVEATGAVAPGDD